MQLIAGEQFGTVAAFERLAERDLERQQQREEPVKRDGGIAITLCLHDSLS
jgi:Spy/CpxP family protein refolding chaperone